MLKRQILRESEDILKGDRVGAAELSVGGSGFMIDVAE